MKTMKNLLLALALIAVAPVVAGENAEASKPGYLSQAGSIALNTICSPVKELFGLAKAGYKAYAPSRQTVGHVAKRAAQLSVVALLVILANKGINCTLNRNVTDPKKFKNVLFGENAEKVVTVVSGIASRIKTSASTGLSNLGQWLKAPHFRN